MREIFFLSAFIVNITIRSAITASLLSSLSHWRGGWEEQGRVVESDRKIALT